MQSNFDMYHSGLFLLTMIFNISLSNKIIWTSFVIYLYLYMCFILWESNRSCLDIELPPLPCIPRTGIYISWPCCNRYFSCYNCLRLLTKKLHYLLWRKKMSNIQENYLCSTLGHNDHNKKKFSSWERAGFIHAKDGQIFISSINENCWYLRKQHQFHSVSGIALQCINLMKYSPQVKQRCSLQINEY